MLEELAVAVALAALRVRIWKVDLAQPVDDVRRCETLLSSDERQRASAFRVEHAKRAFVLARWALRTIASQYLQVPPNTVDFVYGEYGKPALSPARHQSDLQFNVSHSGDLSMLAFCHGRRVGIDVEQIRTVPEAESIAARYFAPAECALLTSTPGHRYQETFFQIWTRKEAALKATGDGITHGLNTPDVSESLSASGPRSAACQAAHAGAEWIITDVQTEPTYAAAVAVEVGRNA